jgi:MscS family membrane protein
MTADWNEFLAVQEDLIMRIMTMITKAGTAFAIPAQTVYYTPDRELNRVAQDKSTIPRSSEELKGASP